MTLNAFDDRPDETPESYNKFVVTTNTKAGTVPGDYILTYVNGVAVTIQDVASTFGNTSPVWPGMPWSTYQNVRSDAVYMTQDYLFKAGVTDRGPYSRDQWERDAANLADFDDSQDLINVGFKNPFVSGGMARGGRGGGRGGLAPVYESPNRQALEQTIKSYLVAVTGTNRPELLRQAVDAYLANDRKEFDRQVAGTGGEQIDPMQAVYGVIRGSNEYKVIHELRPDSVDELDWVTSRQGKLRQIGLSANQSERLGIMQAQVGSNDDAIVDAAEMQFNTDTGRLLRSQRESLKQSARAVVGLV